MAPSASYVCQSMLLYETSGPKVQSCLRETGDTTWLVDRDKDGHVLAAGWEAMVPLDQLDEVTETLEDRLTQRYGPPDSCVSRTGTLKRWRWWPAGRYTVQARLVDPSPLYKVKRGRVEVQAVPAEAVVCLTWVHTPVDLGAADGQSNRPAREAPRGFIELRPGGALFVPQGRNGVEP